MKGRTEYNNPTTRKKEIYQLLIQAGGEARWKTLKAHLNELRLGPTTLKQALDEMIKEKSITKEARIGPQGAEVWYKTTTNLKEITQNQQKTTQPKQEKPEFHYIEQYFTDFSSEVSKRRGQEKTEYLKAKIPEVFKLAIGEYAAFLSYYVRGAQSTPLPKLDYMFDYYINGIFIDNNKFFLRMLAECPAVSLMEIEPVALKDISLIEQIRISEEKEKKRSKMADSD